MAQFEYYTHKPYNFNAFISRNGYVIKRESIAPDDIMRFKQQLYVTPKIPDEYNTSTKPFSLYHEDKYSIVVPRYWGLRNCGYAPQLFAPTNINFEFKKDLRTHQQIIVNKILPQIIETGGGLISLPCGGGKTILALWLAYHLKVKTLVLVHKSFLQDQWIERAKEFTTAKLGIIRQSVVKTENMDIVIGMIQSISMREYNNSIFDDFGLVIVDECHHVASRVFSRALYKTGTKYTIGLSATPQRQDGLSCILHWYLGKMLYSEERNQDKNIIVQKFNLILEDPLFEEKRQWSPLGLIPSIPKMITNLTQIYRRNQIIINIVNTLRQNSNRKILILSGRISHLEYLKLEIDKQIKLDEETGKNIVGECKTCFYMGKSKMDERRYAEINGDIFFASYEMAQEGFDVPRLNTLILATPKGSVIQAIGRITRKILSDLELKPMIIDICDNLSVLYGQGQIRHKLYRKNGFHINEYMVDNSFQVPIYSYHKNNNRILSDDNIPISKILDPSMTSQINDESHIIKHPNYSNNHITQTQMGFRMKDMYNTCLFD